MDLETKEIIRNIASIQVEALTNISNNIYEVSQDLISTLLNVPYEYAEDEAFLKEEIQHRIDMYKQILEYPSLIRALNEYQLYICSHILFQMEDEWMIDNSQGVMGAWALLIREVDKFHPELTLLWCYGKK